MVPCRVAGRPRSEVSADAEAGPEEDQQARQEEDPDLGAKAAGAEFVHAARGAWGAAHLGEDDADD